MQTEVGFTPDLAESDGGWSLDGSDDDEEVNTETLWNEEDIINHFLETRKTRNLGIAYYFTQAFECPDRTEWMGRDGTIAHICSIFNIEKKKRKVVRRILQDFIAERDNNRRYDGLDRRRANRGMPSVIEPGSNDDALIAD